MFQPAAHFFTVLRIEHSEIARKFSMVDFVDSINLTYPPSEREDLVMNAFQEVLEKLISIPGISTTRSANALHYTYDDTAEDLESFIVEKHSIILADVVIGTIAVCAEGKIYGTAGTLQ